MASNWSSEYYVALEGRDLQANAMAVDSTGTYILLAGRRYIAIKNLNEEYELLQKFPRQSKYEVGAAEWNPTVYNKELCVISSNQRIDVLTWCKQELIQSYSLRAHTRVITDVNWHRTDPNLLASCSVDTFIHIWDLRDPRRPSLSLSAIAEASQVRWNRVSPHLLATAHEGDIKIWDQRKGTAPTQYIAAHLAKIHGLDWSPISENQLASSSQDNTVKFFDISNPRKPEYVLTTNAPVWRARFTPFGNGLVTVVVPQLRRGENSLLLWNTANRATPMHTFIGHRDVVLEFEWRKQHPAERDFQLITWSKDQTLLVWRIEPFLQKLCGHQTDEIRELEEVNIDSSNPIRIQKKMSSKVQPLQHEFSLLNIQIPNLQVTKLDATARICLVQTKVSTYLINLQISFPNGYPHGVPPVFQVQAGSSVIDPMANQILQTLNHLAQQRVSKNRTCLESCLRQLVATLEQLARDSENETIYETTYIEPVNVFGGYNDAYIPFPRTSGAKFCSADILVCFGWPAHTRRSAKIDLTPRALSALEAVYSKRNSDRMIAHYYQKRFKSRRNISKSSTAVVHIYDASGMFLVNRQLAEEYILNGDVSTICKHNAAAAAVEGRWDLVQAWTLAELVAGPQQAEEDNMWHVHPFGNKLMQSLITHYAANNDVQMAAMLCCIFGKDQECSSNRKSSLKALLSPGSGGSPYHTIIPPADVIADGWVFPSLKTARSSSLDNLRLEEAVSAIPLRPTPNKLYEYYKIVYAEILYRWGLLYKRAEVLKYMCTTTEMHWGVEFVTECKYCMRPVKQCSCHTCKRISLNCVICHISVRGSANCCLICGHGGHTKHLQQWFKQSSMCPAGCGCKCLQESAGIFFS